MRRIALIATTLVAGAAAFSATAPAGDSHTYSIEMFNAFGVVQGSDVRVAGVTAGSVKAIDINSKKRAVVTVELSGPLSVLGTQSRCSSEPQSLIAEYFIDCKPKGPPIEHSDDLEKPDIPAEHVKQTVQNDLVQNILREPYKQRLQLLINEFGTALAGNADNLNEAIRLGAPALTQLHKVTSVLADQNTIIANLNSDSDKIIGRLNQRSEDVVAFIKNARDTASASAERGDDLSQDFGKLDDFLAEFKPTLVRLDELATTQTPVLEDLHASAGGLNKLMLNLPAFNSATETSLKSLGDASEVGKRALQQGQDEIRLLAESGKKAPQAGEELADFLRDTTDPSRSVEADTRAAADTGDPNRKGYTGLEGLLNYVYYQAGSLNQFDSIGHLLHFSLYYIQSGPCGEFSSGRDASGNVSLPTNAGGTTSSPTISGPASSQIHNCIGWLGPDQPGVNDCSASAGFQSCGPGQLGYGFPPYDKSVCPHGTSPAAAENICSPTKTSKATPQKGGGGSGGGAGGKGGASVPGTNGLPLPDLPDNGPVGDAQRRLQDTIDRILGGNGNSGGDLRDLPRRLRERLRQQQNGGGHGGGGGGSGNGGANDLLDFLLGP
jgi:ABC-type transporter Mla subunit MlaD